MWAVDGLCIGCGKSLDDGDVVPPKEHPGRLKGETVDRRSTVPEGTPADPWALKPESQRATVPAPAGLEPGVLVLSLKKLGFEVTLADAAKWTEAQIAQAEHVVKTRAQDTPAWLAAAFKGQGTVAGATSREPEMPISQLCSALESQKVFVGILEMAKRTPEERSRAAEYALGKSPMPRWLAAFKEVPGPSPAAPPSEVVGEKVTAARAVVDPAKTPLPDIPAQVIKLPRRQVTVTETWGEEKFGGPANSYSTCTVGPFSETWTVHEGEDAQEVRSHLRAKLAMHAEEQRVLKLAGFVEAVKQLKASF